MKLQTLYAIEGHLKNNFFGFITVVRNNVQTFDISKGAANNIEIMKYCYCSIPQKLRLETLYIGSVIYILSPN